MALPNKVFVAVKFCKSGLQPPIYLAGSFSDPEWQPQEMQHTLNENNEHQYYKEVEVESGKEYQYKFRIGQGDWWVLDEDSKIATDNIGNRNNLLVAAIPELPKKTEKPDFAKMPSLDDTKKEPAATIRHIHESTIISAVPSSVLPGDLDSIKNDKYLEEDQKSVEVDAPPPPALLVADKAPEPNHNPDIDEDSSDVAKDEQLLKTRAAEPDYVVLRSETRTPNIADSAAEVADSAESLDRRSPTPPMSDEVAGRIGFRRMSQTPIPEVADVAAEVADSAAILDREGHGFKIEIPTPSIDVEEPESPEEGSGTVTPCEERAPRFSHECPELPQGDLRPASRREDYESSGPRDPFETSPVDLNDPSLEKFPSSREAIYEQVRSCQRRLSEDQVSIEGIPPSPVVGADYHPEQFDLPSPSPNILVKNEERSPSLDCIPEEQGHREELLTTLPKAVSPPKSTPASEGAGRSSDEGQGVSRIDGSEGIATYTPAGSDEPCSDEADGSRRRTILDANDSSPSNTAKDISRSSEVKENGSPDLPAPQDKPSVTIFSYVRGLNLQNRRSSPIDSAKVTTLEGENRRSQLKFRKQSTPAADRPITPNSVRSAGKDAKSKNFLKTFLRLVFVDWIGGFIMRLCDGGRRTLLAITALVIIAVAPAVYFSALMT